MPDEPAQLGAAVRAARRSAGLSIAQVSASTRIRTALLEDLEAGRTDSCGGSVYVRGHLRAIAGATMTDPADLLAAYERRSAPAAAPLDARRDAEPQPGRRRGRGERDRGAGPARPARGTGRDEPTRQRPAARPASAGGPVPQRAPGRRGAGPPRPAARRPPAPGRPARRDRTDGSLRLPSAAAPERRGPRWGLALGLVSGGLALLVAVGLLQPADQPGAGPVAAVAASPTPSASPPPRVDPSAVARVPQPTGAALRVRVLDGASWVQVSAASGRTLFSGVLREGRAQDFTDRTRLRVTVGDAGAVNLICGGKDAPAGGAGQVRRYTCVRGGFAPS